MRATIDKAGRLVVPKPLRDQVGLGPGAEVDIVVDGAGLRVDPVSAAGFVDDDGFLVIPATGPPITDEQVRALRLGDQK